MRELLQVREHLEGLTASLAATNVDQEVTEELGNILYQIKEVVEDSPLDVDKLALLDSQFHLSICRASKNSLVNELLTYVIPSFQASNQAVIYIGESLEQLLSDHTEIYSAIVTKDARAAEIAMRKHIVRVQNEIHNISSSLTETDENNSNALHDKV